MKDCESSRGWVRTTVGDSADFITGFPFSSARFSQSGVKLIRGSNVKRGEIDWSPDIARYWHRHEPALRSMELELGDIVIAMDGALVGRSYARVRRENLPAYLVQRVARLRGRIVDQELLYQWIGTEQFTKHVDNVKTHTAIPHISPKDILGFSIYIPKANREQRVIAHALHDLDDLIAALERLIAKKRAVKQGMMQELLTGRTRLPGFTEPWQLTRLGNHVSYLKTVPLSRAQLDSSSALRCLHYGDIHTCETSRLDVSTADMPRAPMRLARNAGHLQVGDVVFADASEDPDGVGKSVEISDVPYEGAVPGLHTIAARFDKRILADGFKAYLQFIEAFRVQLLALVAGTKVLATTRAYISRIELMLPGVTEQEAIGGVLRDADTDIAALERRLTKARAIKTGMMQELLTGRTRLVSSEVAA